MGCLMKLGVSGYCVPKIMNIQVSSGYRLNIRHFVGKRYVFVSVLLKPWGTGIRGLMRGMATLPQGNQELLVVRDKVGRPQVSLG